MDKAEPSSLHAAAATNDSAALEDLIATGVDLNALDSEGLTALDHSLRVGEGDASAILMRWGGKRASELARTNARKLRRDRVNFLTQADVDHVVGRLPEAERVRLRTVYFSSQSRGVQWLGWVTKRGRRDVTLCSILPVRVSLTRFLHGRKPPGTFGAARSSQWMPWAVRRFLLYDVLLHEIGHLQLVDEGATDPRRRYAAQTLAREFADRWRQQMWTTHDASPDPVHNKPADDEMSLLPLWAGLNKAQRFDLVVMALQAPHERRLDVAARLGKLTAEQEGFLNRALYSSRRSPTDGSQGV